MSEIVEIHLHGVLGEKVGEKWNLAVKSVGEAMRGIEVLSGHKLYKNLIENDKKGVGYRVLINKRDFFAPEKIDINKPSTIAASELSMKVNNLKSIDIVPILMGSGDSFLDILQIIIGVVLIIVALWQPYAWWTIPVILAGFGFIASGVMGLLTKPPSLEPYQAAQKKSYLFSGPSNVVDEGIPVPVVYGKLLVGSIVMSADYDQYLYYTGEKQGQKTSGTGGGSSHIGQTYQQQ